MTITRIQARNNELYRLQEIHNLDQRHAERVQDVRLVRVAVRSYQLINTRPGIRNKQRIQRGVFCFHKGVEPFKTREYVEQVAQVVLCIVIIPARHGLRVIWRLNHQHIVLDCELGPYRIKRQAANLNDGLQRLQNRFEPFLPPLARWCKWIQYFKGWCHVIARDICIVFAYRIIFYLFFVLLYYLTKYVNICLCIYDKNNIIIINRYIYLSTVYCLLFTVYCLLSVYSLSTVFVESRVYCPF